MLKVQQYTAITDYLEVYVPANITPQQFISLFHIEHLEAMECKQELFVF